VTLYVVGKQMCLQATSNFFTSLKFSWRKRTKSACTEITFLLHIDIVRLNIDSAVLLPGNISPGSDRRQKYEDGDKSTHWNARKRSSFTTIFTMLHANLNERVRRLASLVHTVDFLNGIYIKCTTSLYYRMQERIVELKYL